MRTGGGGGGPGEPEGCPEELYNLRKLAEVAAATAEVVQVEVEGAGGCLHGCPECGRRYSTSSNLARHRQTHRSLGDKKARRCPHCAKVYVSIPAYSMHVRTHSQGCRCHVCGKCFSRPWLLQGHIRTHTGEKPFKCTVCAKAFADKSNLRAHVQTHSSAKPHVCARCGKAFALKSYLYKHEESSCTRTAASTSTSTSTAASAMAKQTSQPTSVIVERRLYDEAAAAAAVRTCANRGSVISVISANPASRQLLQSLPCA